jgi:hypothetical protein
MIKKRRLSLLPFSYPFVAIEQVRLVLPINGLIGSQNRIATISSGSLIGPVTDGTRRKKMKREEKASTLFRALYFGKSS